MRSNEKQASTSGDLGTLRHMILVALRLAFSGVGCFTTYIFLDSVHLLIHIAYCECMVI